MQEFHFIDLFAGAGGLSEGFLRAGFKPVAHIEMDPNACRTLETRIAFHYLHDREGGLALYEQYLKGEISRDRLLKEVPRNLLDSVINAEISSDTIDEIFSKVERLQGDRPIDVLLGGPPCQAYSLVGRARDPHKMVNDKRNYLFKEYAKFLLHFKPKFFVFENVLGLLTAGNKVYLQEMLRDFEEIGYKVQPAILAANEYGVLQKRKRVVLIGKYGVPSFAFPKIEKTLNSWTIGRDLFADLPAKAATHPDVIVDYSSDAPSDYLRDHSIRNGSSFVSQHYTRANNERDLKIYQFAIRELLDKGSRLRYDQLSPELQNHRNTSAFLDRFKVVDPKGLSHTMVAHISKDGHYYIYPSKEETRSLTVREAARIQSFPDDFYFEGGRTAAFRQIGNAVPPLMAEAIANAIFPLLQQGEQAHVDPIPSIFNQD
jgi:DNA (cytosine-5)-methyltransferase 1